MEAKNIIQEQVIRNYSKVFSCTILGAPASSKNSRQGKFLSKSARKYENLFKKHIERLGDELKDFPLYDTNYFYYFEIFHERESSDADIELIFDMMQKYGMITNDNIIRDYWVNATSIDKEIPRTNIFIYKKKENKNDTRRLHFG
jgi:hypothetical protein